MRWRDQAACAGDKSVDWFPVYDWDDLAGWNANLAAARAICDACPVKAQCLAAGMADPRSAGIWAGTTESQRHRVPKPSRRRVEVTKCATPAGYMRHRRLGEEPCRECKEAHAMAHRLRKHRLAVVR